MKAGFSSTCGAPHGYGQDLTLVTVLVGKIICDTSWTQHLYVIHNCGLVLYTILVVVLDSFVSGQEIINRKQKDNLRTLCHFVVGYVIIC